MENKIIDACSYKTSKFIVKRIVDVIVSCLALLFFLPLIIVIVCLIKLENPIAPVIFSQERVGKNGAVFKMYKFRTMIIGAEDLLFELLNKNELEGPFFKMKNDPRVTIVGKFLRKYSLDELPQLVNVLFGEMSVVGPRPALPREVAQYTEEERQRLQVKPGCSGIWQVSKRSDCSFKEMLKLDLYYIKHHNLKLDIQIILKTILVMVIPNGAY